MIVAVFHVPTTEGDGRDVQVIMQKTGPKEDELRLIIDAANAIPHFERRGDAVGAGMQVGDLFLITVVEDGQMSVVGLKNKSNLIEILGTTVFKP